MGIKDAVKAMIPNTLKYRIKRGLNQYYNHCMLKRYHQLTKDNHAHYPMGINLIGDIKAETGLGQSMRILAAILEENNIPFVVLQMNQPGGLARNQGDWDHKISEKAVYAINLIHINNSEWAENYLRLPEDVLAGRYNIAYWLWELEQLPKQWLAGIDTVDEIWAPSEFICKCYRQYTDKPVIRIPYSICLETPVKFDRTHFVLPEDVFLFLIMYDFKSISERKNPKGMVDAFCKAFTPEEANANKIGLIVKINHVETKQELNTLKEELKEYKHVYYITDNLSREEVEALIATADVLISLHRSEGFGLPLAEAMYLGTPVVATNWSATTEFMTDKTACLVNYKMVSLDKQLGPYPAGSRWADADISQAVEYMQRLYKDSVYYEQIKREAARYIREKLNYKAVGEMMLERLPNSINQSENNE